MVSLMLKPKVVYSKEGDFDAEVKVLEETGEKMGVIACNCISKLPGIALSCANPIESDWNRESFGRFVSHNRCNQPL